VKLTRPLLRYHGGKWRLAPWIIANMPKHRFYVEPFGGGGSVLLRKPRSYGEVYNDVDGAVVNVFRVVRDPASAKELQRQLELTPFAREEFNRAYEETTDPIEAARRTLIKSFMGFSADAMFRHLSSNSGMRVVASSWKAPTGMRTHVKRTGTTPAADWAKWPAMIHLFTNRLSGVVIENRDATAIMLQHDDAQALHYVDPPYVHSTRRSRHGYRNELTDEDHRSLAVVLRNLKGAVLLSAYPSPLYRELYEGWTLVERDGLAQKSLKTVECLWFNKSAFDALPQPLLEESEVPA
jgi:DNA adenine methylase